MEKSRNVFFRINMILLIVSLVLWLPITVFIFLIGLFGFVFGGAVLEQGLFEASANLALFAVFIFVLCAASLPIRIACLIVSCVAKSKHTKGLYIATIILCSMTLSGFGLAAAILGIKVLNKQQQEMQQQVLIEGEKPTN